MQVISVVRSRDIVTARVQEGTTIYPVDVPLIPGKRKVRCACKFGESCGHAVAAMLYVAENFRGAGGDMFEGVPAAKRLAFLKSAINRDARLRLSFLVRLGGYAGVGNADYRGIVDEMFAKLARPRKVCAVLL